MNGKRNGISDVPMQMTLKKGHLPGGIEGGQSLDLAMGTTAKEPPFEYALRVALDSNKIADARTLVANAEAVLATHEAAVATRTETLTQARVAAAKARIAIATGDGAAARAILVQAIERNPKTPALKTLMTEVMMSSGRATDVRPVLKHLSSGVAVGPEPSGDIRPAPSTKRDTSGR